MPLQLVNHGKHTIVLFPRISICQLIIVRLTSDPEKTYGDSNLSSKYMDDDGGPSYWWRDKQIRKLQQAMGKQAVADRIQKEILELIGPREPDLIDRFETLIERLPAAELTNPHEILDHFARSEDRGRRVAQLRRNSLLWVGPAFFLLSLGSLFSIPFGGTKYTWLHYICWALTIVALVVSGWVFFFSDPLGEYLGNRELEEIRRSRR
jgi:hypothetical protein